MAQLARHEGCGMNKAKDMKREASVLVTPRNRPRHQGLQKLVQPLSLSRKPPYPIHPDFAPTSHTQVCHFPISRSSHSSLASQPPTRSSTSPKVSIHASATTNDAVCAHYPW
ncbi:hypothetical protein BJ165DRAFT_1483912 [Panaeolus papilionaceus]|nr:hypothetical protein BJ165DRAFT_1483912 [Panaeolus papilionaceus]